MLVCPRTHVWLRLCAGRGAGAGWAQLGLTRRGVDDVGALDAVRARRADHTGFTLSPFVAAPSL